MKQNTYKNYRICPECKQKLPLTREYFKRLKLANHKEAFHYTCKSCEEKIKRSHEWKDGKLLCHKCGEYKDVSNFGRNKDLRLRDYHKTFCNSCQITRKKELETTKDTELILQQVLTQRWHGAKERSVKQGLDFDITVDYLLQLWKQQNGICAMSGIPMTTKRYNGRIPTNVSIDKIDRNKGYTIGNVQLVCMACNQIKSDWSDEVMYNICKKIVEQYENKNNKSSERS